MQIVILALVVLTAFPAMAQEPGGLSTRNPLDEIRDEVVQVLATAEVPFTEEQARAIVLVLEESRRASEQLFGEVMDFRDGPPQGERLDRARAGIQWMNDDFSKRVRQYLTEMQRAAWDMHLAEKAAALPMDGSQSGTAGTKEQVQQIRINSNPYTAENQYFGYAGSGGSFGFAGGGGVSAEIFQRGGTGAFHGAYEFRFRDESLNARNAFSPTRPPYQQRNFNVNTSGPIIRNRLTVSVGGSQTEQDNVGTINAQTPTGPYYLGFTRPYVSRNAYANGTYQIRKTQSLQFNFNYGMNRRENQGMGGFNLPSRAFSGSGNNKSGSIRHLWFKSERLVQDISYNFNFNHDEITPVTVAPSIEVVGAFSDGGFPEKSAYNGRTHNVRALWIYTGSRWALRTGGNFYTTNPEQISENNFLGNFQFSSLEAFQAGQPTSYRVTRGEPRLEITHREWSAFLQNDYKYSDRITFFFGLRYEGQNDVKDRNNLDPRIGIAYAVGNSTVLRAGAGVFHMRVDNWIIREMLRLDGTRQYEIIISNPSYPDPFQTGDVTVVPPGSRRIYGDSLSNPYYTGLSFAIEQSLPRNLFVSASIDYHRGASLPRTRDLNAPLPGTLPDATGKLPRPDPTQGNIWLLESTGSSKWTGIKVNMRQRFSIFNVNAGYTFQLNTGDASADGAFVNPSNSYDLAADWANYPRHQFSGSLNSRLPFDIFLTTSFALNSGNRYSITTGKDDNGDGITNDRPLGMPRFTETGPIYKSIGFNISKAFRIGASKNGDAKNLNFFANMDNAFNTVNLGTPSGTLTSPFFGKSTSASNPREIEVGLRFQF
ncbi:MAG TPA: TonB-dependent receptor [Terriglobia bacterium]|nr:TonB-dependent receptor [Terriglobia bacterium]